MEDKKNIQEQETKSSPRNKTRCDECDQWVYEETNMYGRGIGHCPYRAEVDGAESPCGHVS